MSDELKDKTESIMSDHLLDKIEIEAKTQQLQRSEQLLKSGLEKLQLLERKVQNGQFQRDEQLAKPVLEQLKLLEDKVLKGQVQQYEQLVKLLDSAISEPDESKSTNE